MKLLVDRKYKKDTYTISNLYVDGKSSKGNCHSVREIQDYS